GGDLMPGDVDADVLQGQRRPVPDRKPAGREHDRIGVGGRGGGHLGESGGGRGDSHGSLVEFEGTYLYRHDRFRMTMAMAFIDSKRTSRIRIPPAAIVWKSAFGSLA